jgi:two-component system, OmpR family, phosphate regulon response regulator OmpR
VSDAKHILVVDDDRRIRELLKSFLTQNDYLVTVAADAADARKRVEGMVFDLVVLDVMMPGESGLSFAGALRSIQPDAPVLMLSALSETEDRIRGLSSGSDDYLAKPFEPRELLLRIQNLLRRSTPAKNSAKFVSFGNCTFSVTNGELVRSGERVRLTSGEKELLRILLRGAGKPVSRYDLVQPGSDEGARSVDVQINRLRQKIEIDPANPVCLQTIRGAGYVLVVDDVLKE